MKKIKNIQALRGIAVLLVVLFHLEIIERKYGGTQTLLPDIFGFGMFGVDLFFVISGFVMVVITRGKFQSPRQAIRFLYHRISRIYPIYWVYSLLVLGVFLFNPALVNSSQGNQIDILASFLLFPSETLPLVNVGWTLIHEIYFYLVFFFVMLFVPERFFPTTILVWASGIVVMGTVLQTKSPLIQLVTHPLTIEFIAGCLLAIIFFRKNSGIMKTGALIALAFIGLILSLYGLDLYHQMTGEIEPIGWWRILIFGIPAMLLVFCFTCAEQNGFVFSTFMVKIGDASYSIYLSHILTLSVSGKVWAMFSSQSLTDNALMIPVLVILAIVIGMISYTVIEKPLMRLLRRLA